MAKQYYSVITDYGSQAIAEAVAKQQPLQITQMAVGDGNGQVTVPNRSNTQLVNEVHRANISSISVDPRNDKQIIFELTIPENIGGFWIREMGIFDNQNHLIAYANCPDSFKPQLESGSGKVQVIRMILLVNSSDAVTLKVDDSVIFVTRGQLTPKTITDASTNGVDETGHSHEINKANTTQAGIVQLTNDLNNNREDLGLTAKAGKALKALIDAITSNLSNYIPNSKKSNAVNSTSSDTVATSYAAKTAYDKGVEALNVANSKQSPATTLAGYGITDFKVLADLGTADLDTVTTVGVYGQAANKQATSDRHYPDGYAGSLQVLPSAYGVMQIYTLFNKKHVYVRNMSLNGAWDNWVRVDGLNKLDLTTGGTVTGGFTCVPYLRTGTSEKYGILTAGSNSVYISNTKAKKALEIKDTGELQYDGTNVALETSNVASATKLQTPRTIKLVGDVTGSASFDGSSDISIDADINVGGRNLLRNTSKEWTKVVMNTWNASDMAYFIVNKGYSYDDYNLKPGDTLTYSAWIKMPDDALAGGSLRFSWSREDGNYTSSNSRDFVMPGEERKVIYTVKVPDDPTFQYFNCLIHRSNSGPNNQAFNFYVKEAKLERGSIATDWTPAPEDVDANIQAVSTKADNAYSRAELAERNSLPIVGGNLTGNLTAPYINVSGPRISVNAKDSQYAGFEVIRQGNAGSWRSRVEQLPDKRWNFWTEGLYNTYVPAKSGTLAIDHEVVHKTGDVMNWLVVQRSRAYMRIKSTSERSADLDFVTANGEAPQVSLHAVDIGGYANELRINTTPPGSDYNSDRRQHVMTVGTNGDIWTRVYGWLHDRFMDKTKCYDNWYPRHYNGAHVFKIPTRPDGSGIKITAMQATINGDTELLLPESYNNIFYVPIAVDTGASRHSLGISPNGNNKVKVYCPSTPVVVNVYCIGWSG